jgi:hypothetical protein
MSGRLSAIHEGYESWASCAGHDLGYATGELSLLRAGLQRLAAALRQSALDAPEPVWRGPLEELPDHVPD